MEVIDLIVVIGRWAFAGWSMLMFVTVMVNAFTNDVD